MRVLSRIPPLSKCLDDLADLIIHGSDLRRIGPSLRISDFLVGVEIVLRGLIGRVRRSESEVKKQRRRDIVRIDHPYRFCTEQLGIVALFFDQFVVPKPVRDTMRFMLEVVNLSNQGAIRGKTNSRWFGQYF